MLEVARAIDVASPVMENVFVEQIKNASASDIKQALEAIVQESQKEQEKNGKGVSNAANQAATTPARPVGTGRTFGVNRPNQQNAQPAAPEVNASLVTNVSDADRGMIRGKVLILADERSNKLIIVTQKSNMDFFKKVIEQLDIETTPDTVVKVYRLKYAEAEEVSDMINDLIGNAAGSKSSSKQNQNANAKSGSGANLTRNSGSGTSTAAKTPANQRSGEAKAGELTKDNTTVLADKRINGLVVMTNKDLVPVIEQIIEAMDVKLSQVLIETCIVEVNLNDTVKTGIDWVHQISERQAMSGGGGSTSRGSALGSIATGGVTPGAIPTGSGLNYMGLSKKLNVGAVIEASKSDSRTKYLASPIIMTVDNKEATIEATQMRYMLTGFTSSGTSYSTIAVPNYAQKEIGITIKTTPKINPNGTVMLTVEEEYSQLVEKGQVIQTNSGMAGTGGTGGGLMNVDVDTTITRKMSADISLENHQTVVIGGLVETKVGQIDAGIPILKDIPWIGRYLFGKTEDTEERKELLVFMTPYVLEDGAAAQAEAARRKQALSETNPWSDHGWSESGLADPIDAKEKLRRQQEEWKKQDQERASELAIEEAKANRAAELERRAAEDAEKRAKEAKKLEKELNEIEEKKSELRAESDLRAREENSLLHMLYEETSAAQKAEEPNE